MGPAPRRQCLRVRQCAVDGRRQQHEERRVEAAAREVTWSRICVTSILFWRCSWRSRCPSLPRSASSGR
ncbi:MAG: hypothetical protein FJ271_08520 [Planctomycetes bacterium]|nr:hypothetical protein [Planctomycetota bacterium]